MTNHLNRYPRSYRLEPYRRALDRIEAYLDLTGADDEEARIDRAVIFLFGESPAGWEEGETQFEDPEDGFNKASEAESADVREGVL